MRPRGDRGREGAAGTHLDCRDSEDAADDGKMGLRFLETFFGVVGPG